MDESSRRIDPYFLFNDHVSSLVWGISLTALLFGLFSILGTSAEAYRLDLPKFLPLVATALSLVVVAALSNALTHRRDSGGATLGSALGRAYGTRFILPSLVGLVGLCFAAAGLTLSMRVALGLWGEIGPTLPGWTGSVVVGIALIPTACLSLTRLSRLIGFCYSILLACLACVIAIMFAQHDVRRPDFSGGAVVDVLSRGWTTVALFAGVLLQPAIWQRVASRAPAATRRRGLVILGSAMFAVVLASNLIGQGARSLLPPRVDGEWKVAPHPLLGETAVDFERVLPAVLNADSPLRGGGFAGVVSLVSLIALFATALACSANQLLAMGTVVVGDFYTPLLRPKSSLREQVIIARLIMIVSMTIALCVIHLSLDEAKLRPILLAVELGFLAAGYSLQLWPMVVDFLWIKRGSALGAVVGLVVGLALTTLSSPLLGLLVERYLSGFACRLEPFRAPGNAALFGLVANALIFAFLSPRRGDRASGRSGA
jgi:Na+/proline symporter